MAIIMLPPEVHILCDMVLHSARNHTDIVIMRRLAKRIKELDSVTIETKDSVEFPTLKDFAERHRMHEAGYSEAAFNRKRKVKS